LTPGPADLGAAGLLAAYARAELRPSDALAAVRARLDACEAAVGAFVTRCDDVAERAAAESDARWAAGDPRALEGVPFAVKDVVDTAGVRTTSGSELFAGRIPDADAPAVALLRASGAVLVGKTATPEFAFGDAIEGHRARNPWDTSRWCGGSSAGSAVALAAREVPLALGTDTGGSIRVPASYCGVSGCKPTFGTVPRAGVTRVAWSFDTVGPMARAAEDLALALAVLAGRQPPAPAGAPAPGAHPLAGTRVGIARGWLEEGADDGVLAARDAAADVVRELGASCHDVALPRAELAGVVAWTITVAEFAAAREAERHLVERFTPSAAARLAAGSALSARDYLRAVRARHILQRDLASALAGADVLLTPATPTPAPRIAPDPDPLFAGGDSAWLHRIARTFLLANVTGAPAVVVPAGEVGGLPVGVQLLAPPHGEAAALRVAAAFQAHTDHHRRAPAMPRPRPGGA
jgi:aspartyl-tRNA(Asn)/glutamyl-tRNA(Gln) amidotransferase subunit A